MNSARTMTDGRRDGTEKKLLPILPLYVLSGPSTYLPVVRING